MKITKEIKDKVFIHWKYWDTRIKKMWDAGITSGPRYGHAFKQCQIADTMLRYIDTKRYEDPMWKKVNATLNRRDRRSVIKHQKNLCRSAQACLNSM